MSDCRLINTVGEGIYRVGQVNAVTVASVDGISAEVVDRLEPAVSGEPGRGLRGARSVSRLFS